MGQFPRPVAVLHDGVWIPGWLERVRRSQHGWYGFVRFVEDEGRTHLEWKPAKDLRPLDISRSL